jgi:hypothetical protein
VVVTNTTVLDGGFPLRRSRHALRFGTEAVGQASAAKTLTVTNDSTQPVTLTQFATSGDFALGAGSCVQGGALAASSTCTIAITFTPTSVGPRTGLLTLTDSASTATHSVSLEGRGTSVNGPAASLSALAIELDSSTLGQAATSQTLTVTNPAGGAALDISGVAIEGRNATDFAATTTCTPQLAAGSSCTIMLNFTPTAAPPEFELLTVASDSMGALETLLIGRIDAAAAAGSSTTTNGTTTTTGSTTSAPVVTSSSTALSFTAGAASAQALTLTNAGPGTFAISSLAVSGADPGDFTATDTCAAVPAGSPCTVNVMFQPQASGARSATLQISSNAAAALDIDLQAAAPAGSATLTPSTVALAFAPVSLGSSSGDLSVILTNTGTSAAAVGQLQLSAGGFSIVSDQCSGKTLAAGASCTVTVQFSPQQVGSQSAQLSSKGASAMTAVQVSGTAVAATGGAASTMTGSSGGGGAIGGWAFAGLIGALIARRRLAVPRR